MGIFQVGPSARVHAKFRRQCAAVWRIGCLKCARCMHHHVSMALSYISVRTVTGQRKECDGIIMSTCSGRSDLRMHSTESSGSMRATTGRRITSAALGRLSGCHVRVHLRARQCLGVCMHVCEHVFWFACITESAQVSCCVYWDACMCESMCWCVGVHLGVCACVCVCVFPRVRACVPYLNLEINAEVAGRHVRACVRLCVSMRMFLFEFFRA
jgi:hypothetical protein